MAVAVVNVGLTRTDSFVVDVEDRLAVHTPGTAAVVPSVSGEEGHLCGTLAC